MITTSASAARATTASRISAAVRHADHLDAGGRLRAAVGPLISDDRVRRGCAAAAASAYPIFPLERLPMKRTGSSASRVGPAVTMTRLAAAADLTARGPALPRATMSAGSASRPLPIQPQAR